MLFGIFAPFAKGYGQFGLDLNVLLCVTHCSGSAVFLYSDSISVSPASCSLFLLWWPPLIVPLLTDEDQGLPRF